MRNLHAPLRETDPLSPAEALKRFKLPDDLAVDLIAAEPDVRQPLYLTFDERGRMWVVQYIQYPFPAGLKVVEYDQYIRAKFDKVPPPPPKHVQGRRQDHDPRGHRTATARSTSVKTFVDGLNICTAALPGRGGVWVLNPPYLLFYPDTNRDDVPDGDPVVHLSGFGLEDTHAVASSLTGGRTAGSTARTGSHLHREGEGRAVDRTRTRRRPTSSARRSGATTPTRHVFEIFAEGGGNTFGVEFDDAGRVFSGTNWGKFRGLHYVQGGYYVKGWGKHGPLTNPYAFGFFDHMPHDGNADRLTHTFVVYGGALLPERLHGKIVGPNSLQSRVARHAARADRLDVPHGRGDRSC